MQERVLDGATMFTPDDFYSQFFEVTRGLLPDYGGRNLDALHDDLRELRESLTLRWKDSAVARQHLGPWMDRCVRVLKDLERITDLPEVQWPTVTVLLE